MDTYTIAQNEITGGTVSPSYISPIQGLTNKTGGFGTPEFNSNVIYNMQLEEYERKKAEYDKAKKDFEFKKQAQKKGIGILESGEALYDTRIIIPIGETGFDQFTFNQIKAKIDNKEPGFENVKDVKDYVSKTPGAQIVSYTKDQGRIFEGAIPVEPQIDLFEKYDPAKLNPILGNSVWGVDKYNEEDIIYGLNDGGTHLGLQKSLAAPPILSGIEISSFITHMFHMEGQHRL